MSGNCELGRGLRRHEKNATERGAGRFEKPAPDARAAPPEAHESLIGRKTVEEVPLTGLTFNRARRRIGLPTIPEVGELDQAARARGPGVYWDPQSKHRPSGSPLAIRPRAPSRTSSPRAAGRGPLVTRVMIMPVYGDAAARDVGRSLPEAIAPTAFGPAASLNTTRGWSLRDDHDGPVFDYAGPQLRAHDTPHGPVLEWLPNMRMPWAVDALHAIEDGRSAVSVSMTNMERQISHLPHPVEVITRARLDHVALLFRGQRGCYGGGRARVFRNCSSNDPAQLQKQIAELVATCRWHARQHGGRC